MYKSHLIVGVQNGCNQHEYLSLHKIYNPKQAYSESRFLEYGV